MTLSRDRRTFVAAVILLFSTAACARDEAPKRQPPPDARRVDVATAGTVRGRVTVEGGLPKNLPIKLAGDPVCQRDHPNGATFETFVGENGGLGNVFVYVKDGLGNYYFDAPDQAVTLDQKGCQYRPHVFGVQVGQNVEIVNSDATMHNVHALADTNQEFNFGQPIQKQKDTKFFAAREVMVRFKCDIHGWMSAYAGVLEHPYFAVTVPGGDFELKGVPAGTYTVEAWHEKLGTQTQSVTLGDRETREIGFTFKGATATTPAP